MYLCRSVSLQMDMLCSASFAASCVLFESQNFYCCVSRFLCSPHNRASAVIFASSASKQGGSAKAVDYEGKLFAENSPHRYPTKNILHNATATAGVRDREQQFIPVRLLLSCNVLPM